MSDAIKIEEQVLVGSNRHGYTFAVGRLGDRWVGYAGGGGMLFILPGMSEDHELGLTDRDEAIRRVGACALDGGQGYGGIDEWHVPEDLRGDPDAYRCAVCDEVCCDEDHADLCDDWEP
jgi:hypothetical protein